jgi:uncharacterized protein RhaS with RHS repeats
VRKYDNGIGRFTSCDPLWEKYYGWTPYQYCGNNPLVAVDPSGSEDEFMTAQRLTESQFYPNDPIRSQQAAHAAKIEGLKTWGPTFLGLLAIPVTAGESEVAGFMATFASINNLLGTVGNGMKTAAKLSGDEQLSEGIPTSIGDVATMSWDLITTGTMNGPLTQETEHLKPISGLLVNACSGNLGGALINIANIGISALPDKASSGESNSKIKSSTIDKKNAIDLKNPVIDQGKVKESPIGK